jgi:Zn-dependent peptidase ImmA (M78 family)
VNSYLVRHHPGMVSATTHLGRSNRSLVRRGSGIPESWPNPWTDLTSRTDLMLERVLTLPEGMYGYWSVCSRVILIREGLTVVERRCVLAHEMAHVDVGHHRRTGADAALLAAIQEREADLMAARRLIALPMLAVVADLNLQTAAKLLFVTPELLTERIRHLHPSERHYLRRAIERNRRDTA